MKLKSLFAVLAIFLVAVSICAVSAEDITNNTANYGDDDILLGESNNETADGGEDDSPEVISPAPDENSTDDAPEVISSFDDNETNAAGGVDSQPSSSSLENHATGNPILVLMAALAIIGSVSIKRK